MRESIKKQDNQPQVLKNINKENPKSTFKTDLDTFGKKSDFCTLNPNITQKNKAIMVPNKFIFKTIERPIQQAKNLQIAPFNQKMGMKSTQMPVVD